MSTVTLTIGLNSNQTLQPLQEFVSRRFRQDVDAMLASVNSTIFVQDALSSGTCRDVNSGTLVHEESRTWVADVNDSHLDAIRRALPGMCERYEQDAIAFTTGTTELIGLRQHPITV